MSDALMPGHAPLKFHPLANLFPMLSAAELDDLGADIKANGQVETVKLHRGMILDGRNRYSACVKYGLPVRTEVFTGTDRDALNWVISKNLKRRHLSEGQRAAVAAAIGRLPLGANQHSEAAQICAPALDLGDAPPAAPEETAAPLSQTERADLLNVSRRTVQHADVVFEKGASELQDALRDGKVAASTAADIATLPADEQRKIVAAADPKLIQEAAKKINKEKNDKRRTERVEKIAKIAAGNSALSTARKFPVLYMDPPTKFEAGDSDRSTENHYPTMDEEQLAKLPIGELATADAVLFIWTTVPWLRKTIRLIEGWGFEYVSEYAWDKVKISTGFWNRNRHENLIVATRGRIPAPDRTLLEDSLYSEARTEHSAKPDFFRAMIGRYYPELPKVELFPRGLLPENWHGWGNEARLTQQQTLGIEQSEAAE
jgi:N6-adenosine-specific RNA methylase IME4